MADLSDLGHDPMHLGALHHHSDYPHAMQPTYSELHHPALNPEYATWLLNSGVQLPNCPPVPTIPKEHEMTHYDLQHHQQSQHMQQPVKLKKTPKNKCVSKEMIREKDGTLIYSYTYLMKNSNGEEHLQKINIKKKNGKSVKGKDVKETKTSKKTKKEKAKVPKRTKKAQQEMIPKVVDLKGMKNQDILNLYISEHIVQIKSYNKFTVSRVLQDFKRDYPSVKISYGSVKKMLALKALIPEK